MRIHGGPLSAVLIAIFVAPAPAQEAPAREAPQEESTQPPPDATVPAAVPPSVVEEKPAEPENEGRGYFERAAAAVQQAKAISYSYRSYAKGGMLESVTGTVQAEVRLQRAAGGSVPGWRIHAFGVSTPVKGDPMNFDVAWLERTVEWVDQTAQKVIEKPLLEGRRAKQVTTATLARLDDFTNPRPFQKELLAQSYTVEPRQSVEGVECDVILAAVNNGRLKIRWFLGVDDHLPRRIESILDGRQGASSKFTDLVNLRVSTSADVFGQSEMRVPVPDGFTEERTAPPAPRSAEPPSAPEPTPGATEHSATPTVISTPPVPAGPRLAPDFELLTPEGTKVTLASLRGNVVLLEFAGTWSIGVREARTQFDQVAGRFKARPVKAFSVAIRERSNDTATEEARRGSHEFALLLQGEGAARAFGVYAYPSYAVVGPSGEMLMEPTPAGKSGVFDTLAEKVVTALAGMPETPAKPETKPADGPVPTPPSDAAPPAPAPPR